MFPDFHSSLLNESPFIKTWFRKFVYRYKYPLFLLFSKMFAVLDNIKGKVNKQVR